MHHSSKSPDSSRKPKVINKGKESLINKRFSKAPVILPSSQLSLKSESMKYSSKGNPNDSSINSKRRNTDTSAFKQVKGIGDNFWQQQVHRLMKETKNYKQLHFQQKQDFQEILRENEVMKKVIKKQKIDIDEMKGSLNKLKSDEKNNQDASIRINSSSINMHDHNDQYNFIFSSSGKSK